MIKYKKTFRTDALTGDFKLAKLVIKESISTKEIAMKIEKEIGIPSIRSMSVLDAAAEIIRGLILDGNTVNLSGLGIFKAGLTVENGHPEVKKVLFTPSVELRKELKTASFEEIKEE